MTLDQAFKILGIPRGTPKDEIKKRYRQLMRQVHPDVFPESSYPYNVHEITAAYDLLRNSCNIHEAGQGYFSKRSSQCQGKAKHWADPVRHWDAPENPQAYCEREILHNVHDDEGRIVGHFTVAWGKYLWTADEDFPLFLLSIYQCSKQLLDRAERSKKRDSRPSPALRQKYQAQLAYLLAQQYIDALPWLEKLTKISPSKDDGAPVFYVAAMLEASLSVSLEDGEILFPSRIQDHRLYLKNRAGAQLGYLSFHDDRLYYIIIPLFEQRRVQVKIQAIQKENRSHKAQKPSAKSSHSHTNSSYHLKNKSSGYKELHLWIRFLPHAGTMPENITLQIQALLDRYKALL